ncbi:MAG: TlpA disulfide reductase family protein [Thermodesulfovibrionales bacterium]
MKTIIFLICFVFLFVSVSLALSINDNAPVFSLRDNNGNFFHLSDYINPSQSPLGKGGLKGGVVKGIIINFFSSTCKPCKNELPVLNSLVDEFKAKGIKVAIIGHREDFDKFEEMLKRLKVDKPVVLSDVYGKVGEKYCVKGLPMTFIIGSDGKVKDIIPGELPDMDRKLRERVNRALK